MHARVKIVHTICARWRESVRVLRELASSYAVAPLHSDTANHVLLCTIQSNNLVK